MLMTPGLNRTKEMLEIRTKANTTLQLFSDTDTMQADKNLVVFPVQNEVKD